VLKKGWVSTEKFLIKKRAFEEVFCVSVGRAAPAGYPLGGALSGTGLGAAGTLGALGRRRASSWLRTALLLFCVTFVWLQLHVANIGGGAAGAANRQDAAEVNESAAILSMVPQVSPH